MYMKGSQPAVYHPVRLNREFFSEKMMEDYQEKHEKIWQDLSVEERGMLHEEFTSSLRVLEESLATASPQFFISHARWMHSRFAAESFSADAIHAFFRSFKEVVAATLPEDYRKDAEMFVAAAVSAIESVPGDPGTSQGDEPALSPKAGAFLGHILAGEVAKARTVIDRELAAGIPFREIYSGIFRPVLQETGRLWQQNKVTIAQEHFVTDVVRRTMDQLHTQIAGSNRITRQKKKVVAACVGEELHDVGMRMVADFFDLDGWNVYYIGANTPAKSIISAVKDQDADVVALSITLPVYLSDLHYLIRSLRADPATAQVKIIVGGVPFTIILDLWRQVGADAVAGSAEEAVAVAGLLTAG